MPKTSTKCPFCGSISIKQTNEGINRFFSETTTAIFDYFAGTHCNSNAISDNMVHRYVCNSCGREWVGDGHNSIGIVDESFAFKLALDEIGKNDNGYKSFEEVMRFCYKMDAYCNKCHELDEITHYPLDSYFVLSDEYKSKFYFLKAYICLSYVVNIFNNNEQYHCTDIHMACQSGLLACTQAYSIYEHEEYELCYNVLNYIDTLFFYEINESEADKLKCRCKLPSYVRTFIFSKEKWQDYIKWAFDNIK